MRGEADRLASQWFRTIRRQANPETRLVCFPHAGGSASFFHGWAGFMPTGVELLAVRYPGREDRILDPPADTMEDLADPLVQACSVLNDAPLAFFGHSMGAVVAHEVAQRLGPSMDARLVALFVSGHPGPGCDKSGRDLSALSDAELLEDIRLRGGTAPAAFAQPELRELFLPALREDYRIVASHRMSVNAVIEAPVVAYYGNQDEDIDEKSASAWSAVTKSSFRARSFEGGHFYLMEHAKDLVADLLSHLKVHRDVTSVHPKAPHEVVLLGPESSIVRLHEIDRNHHDESL
jgi:pyochelin biosynthetic protein PchC